MSVVSEHTCLSFKVLGINYMIAPEAAGRLIIDLLRTNKAVSLVFTNIVASRTTLSNKREGVLTHELDIRSGEGPFTLEQFQQMIYFDPNISNGEWLSHVEGLR